MSGRVREVRRGTRSSFTLQRRSCRVTAPAFTQLCSYDVIVYYNKLELESSNFKLTGLWTGLKYDEEKKSE